MTTVEYIQSLEEALKFLPKKERLSIVKVYQNRINNYLDEGYSEDKILKDMPDINQIAKDAYDSKGIDYVKRRKEQIKNKIVFEAIVGFIVILVASFAFGFIMYLVGRHIYNSFDTVVAFSKLKSFDAFSMITIMIIYYLLIVVVVLYIIDLIWLIDSFMLQSIFRLFKKDFNDYKISSFFITTWFDEKIKKKYIIGKVAGILAIIMIILGITSYATKSYMYYSLTGINSNSYYKEVELSTITNNFILQYDEIDLEIVPSEKDMIVYESTLDHKLEVLEVENTITISLKNKYTFDFLSILKEPTPKITLKLTKETATKMNVSFSALKTNVTIKDVTLNNILMDSKIIDGNYLVENVIVNEKFALNSDQMDLHIKNSHFKDVELIGKTGYAIFENNSINNFNFKNVQVTIGIDTLKSDVVEIKNELGTVEIINPIGGIWNYDGYGGKLLINKKEESNNFVVSEISIISANGANISVVDGVIQNGMTMSLDRGNLSFTRIQGDITIKKSNGVLDLVDIIGNIDVTTNSGKLSINSTITKKNNEIIENDIYFNGLNNVKVNSNNTQTYIGQLDIYDLDLVINGGVTVLNEVYGTNLDILIKTGQLQYNNTVRANMLHTLHTLNITKESGTYSLELVVPQGGNY